MIQTTSFFQRNGSYLIFLHVMKTYTGKDSSGAHAINYSAALIVLCADSKACTAFTHSLLCLCSIWLRSSSKKAISVVRLYLRRMGGRTDWAFQKGRIQSGQLRMPLVSCDNQLTTDSAWIAHTSAKSGLTAFLFSFNMFFLSQKRKEEDVSKPPISQI